MVTDTPCYMCVNRRHIPGNTHSRCADPDPDMTGNKHGKDRGWFNYPDNFAPVWRTKECSNFKAHLYFKLINKEKT